MLAVLVSAIVFVVLVPFARQALPPVPGFIPVYQSMLILADLITALLLFGQYRITRPAGMVWLAAGYLFTALLAGVHLLTFPGLFAAGGLLGAGMQSTAWLYMFWHGGFPLFVIAYAVVGHRVMSRSGARLAGLVLMPASVVALAALATAGQGWLPPIMSGQHYTPAMLGVVGCVWLSCLGALVALWRHRRRSVLDLWLQVVMCAWLFDIGLSAVFNAGRYDLGFYAGRLYGLLAATYVLMELLVEHARLHQRLVELHGAEQLRAAELAAARDAALAADEAKGRFLATMSHEIRTPMNAILGMTHLALETDLNPRQRDYLNKVQSASKALMRLLDDILDYSKIEADKLTLEDEVFDLEALIDNVASLHSARAEQAGLALLVELRAGLPRRVIGDSLRIAQVLNNLVSNAIKFTARGEVVLGAELMAQDGASMTVRFFVRDTGIGLSEAQSATLFAPFTQAEASTSRRFGGTGLGLAISQRLTKLMGGQMSITSMPGKGSVFSATVRLAVAAKGDEAAPALPARGLRTLLIDPLETSARILRQMLESWQFPVVTADTALMALQQLHAAEAEGLPFQLVLLDERTGAIADDGGLAHKLRRATHPSAANRPAIMILVSASSMERTLALAGAIPADGVITKPTTPSRLLDAIVCLERGGRDVASRSAPAAAPPSGKLQALRGARVLLVEDNYINQQVAAELLVNAGLHVTLAGNGIEALEHLQDEAFDLVLMDVQMPVMDGLQATRLLRRLPHGAILPVVAMTASARAEDRQDCLNAGMNGHVAKPIDPVALEAILLSWITPARLARRQGLPTTTEGDVAALAARLPTIDVPGAIARVGGALHQYRQLLHTYTQAHGSEGEQALRRLADKDLVGLARQLHGLAGAAAMLGIDEVARLAQSLSHIPHDADPDELLQRVQALAGAQASVIAMLEQLPPVAQQSARSPT
ncbi:response regulator [Aquabacterium sp.]|uniref:response regulator n=1 Tax=Aquabacterium sp. TaxID=1872578 RepID=UPI002CF7193C|nr:response regulator [Aquabacterium sp.]HSW08814.1 response regulator [Aquabacterium sp.]